MALKTDKDLSAALLKLHRDHCELQEVLIYLAKKQDEMLQKLARVKINPKKRG